MQTVQLSKHPNKPCCHSLDIFGSFSRFSDQTQTRSLSFYTTSTEMPTPTSVHSVDESITCCPLRNGGSRSTGFWCWDNTLLAHLRISPWEIRTLVTSRKSFPLLVKMLYLGGKLSTGDHRHHRTGNSAGNVCSLKPHTMFTILNHLWQY